MMAWSGGESQSDRHITVRQDEVTMLPGQWFEDRHGGSPMAKVVLGRGGGGRVKNFIMCHRLLVYE